MSDRSAEDFESMARSEYKRAFRFAFHLTGELESALDLTQDSFRSAWEYWSSFNGESSVSTWLHQIVYRRFIDHYRREMTRARARLNRIAAGQCKGEIENHAMVVQVQQDIRTAVDSLEDPEKLVIVLRYFQGMTVAETSAVTREPMGTVKWRTHRALNQLQKMLCEDFE
ncbi:MAG: sigma-70 family RNA polymerase sigma factor [Planctomycetota bacterium]